MEGGNCHEAKKRREHKREKEMNRGSDKMRWRNNKNANDLRSGKNDKGIKTEYTNKRGFERKF